MKKLTVSIILLALLLAGCRQHQLPEETRSADQEPTITYDWAAETSPIPVKRIGTLRAGLDNTATAVSPTGVYYLYEIMFVYGETPLSPVILYADNGSDTFVRLCGRPDCTHTTEDCNAYIKGGKMLSYYGGYLYVVTEEDVDGPRSTTCKLVRINPDGTDRIVVADLGEFAKEQGCDYAQCDMVTDGYVIFQTCKWEENPDGGMSGETQGTYYYKLDGSMEQPEALDAEGMLLYTCGDVFLTYRLEVKDGGLFGSYWDWNPETDSLTYLTDHPGEPGWFGKTEAYYFMDGALHRLTYATGQDEIVIQTELEGDYYACCLPDCLILVSNESRNLSDKNLYFYNWDFELVDTVQIEYSGSFMVSDAIIGETADRILLTKSDCYAVPTHYIDKAELGTGNAKVHEYDLAAIENMIEAVRKMYPDAGW